MKAHFFACIAVVLCFVWLASWQPVSACTTWMVMPDASDSPTVYLHKNRDWGGGKEQFINMELVAPENQYRYLAVGYYMMINETGLALVDNAIAATTDPTYSERLSNRALMAQLASQCATVSEVTTQLDTIIREKRFSRAVTILAADTTHAAIYEVSSEHLGVATVDSGFALRTNDWLLPETAPVSALSPGAKKASATRLGLAQDSLQSAWDTNGRIELSAIWETARLHGESMPKDRTPYRDSTVSAATFQSDAEFPAVLSTAYVTLGPPCSTIVLPVPIGVDALPEIIRDGTLGKLAFAVKRKLGADSTYRAEMQQIEIRFATEFATERELARAALRQNQALVARELLTKLLQRQSQELCEYLNRCLQENDVQS